MLACVSVIAKLGLLFNSAATIVGAMIVVPLINPIVALIFALETGRKQWTIRATLQLRMELYSRSVSLGC